MCSRTDIFSEIDSPKLPAVQFVTIDIYVSRVSIVGIVVSIGRFPFEDDFVFAISIYIPNACIIGLIGITLTIRGYPFRRNIKGNI
jgi:hypothetical protein